MSGYVIETRRMETRKFPYTFRFAANNGVPYTSARSVKLCLSKKLSFPPCEQFHSAFLSRNSTVLDESICILEPDFPRHYENRVVFKNPKFHGTWRIDSYSRFSYSTVREISLGILDPHYTIRCSWKSNEFSRQFRTLLLLYFSQNLYSKTINYFNILKIILKMANLQNLFHQMMTNN